jgi:hypothetical protein
MKSIITLSTAAVTLTLCAYFFCAGNITPSAQAGGAKFITDLVQEKQAAPPPAPILVAQAGPNSMREALASNDVGAVAQLLKNKNTPDENDVLALLETTDASAKLGEFLGKQGPLLSPLLRAYQNKASRVFLALELAGLARGINPVKQDLKAARKILLGLEQEDPQNGALPFFLLFVEKNLKFGTKELLRTVERISAATEFETYLDEIAEEVSDLRWQSPAHSLFINSYGTRIVRDPDFSNPTGALKGFSPFIYKETLKKIGRLMKKKGDRSNSSIWLREFSAEQYVNGADLAGDQNVMEIYNISAAREKEQGAGILAFPSLMKDGHCDSRAYEEFFYSQRAAN